MAKSQFEKRKEKQEKPIEERVRELIDTPEPETTYNQVGYDVFTSDGGKTYGVAEIEYDPESGQARVKDVFTISRLVALKYANMKEALGILKKKIQK
jgi:hypothetical protein